MGAHMIQERMLNIINGLKQTFKTPQLDFIALALRGKKVNFAKVIKMVDDLITVLGEEQNEDEKHKAYCEAEFDTSDDNKGSHQRRITALQHQVDEFNSISSNLAAEIKILQAGIAALDKSVAEATEMRKNEHAEYVKTSQENQAAIDLIAFAKNRLNKFYNPKLYRAPPSSAVSEEDRIYQNYGGSAVPTAAPAGIAGTGITAFVQLHAHSIAAPPPPPETFGAYSKKSENTGGVTAMMDMLTNDVKKDMHEAEMEEKESQNEYEELMVDSQKKRAADSKLITTKEEAKAEADTIAQAKSDTLSSTNEELSLTNQYISDLHKSCDFLMENYDFRKTARSQEIEALAKAKAILRGADYSLVETSSFLARKD